MERSLHLLKFIENISMVECTICSQPLRADKYDLERHLDSSKHSKKSGNISKLLDKFDFQQNILQIKLSVVAAAKYLSCNFFDEFIPFLKLVAFDPAIIQNLTLNRKLVAKIITNVIAPVYKD